MPSYHRLRATSMAMAVGWCCVCSIAARPVSYTGCATRTLLHPHVLVQLGNERVRGFFEILNPITPMPRRTCSRRASCRATTASGASTRSTTTARRTRCVQTLNLHSTLSTISLLNKAGRMRKSASVIVWSTMVCYYPSEVHSAILFWCADCGTQGRRALTDWMSIAGLWLQHNPQHPAGAKDNLDRLVSRRGTNFGEFGTGSMLPHPPLLYLAGARLSRMLTRCRSKRLEIEWALHYPGSPLLAYATGIEGARV